ncbi:BCCT family transporter [Streptomyces sp. S.PNR 29]|uniref:BCCT family transporter n=1 Tax=Streptomyces sp. S.PNR 29 TaxID=2973805 RepID=UPI00339DA01F
MTIIAVLTVLFVLSARTAAGRRPDRGGGGLPDRAPQDVSGADATSVVLGMLSCRGSMTPGRLVVILWGALTGLVAAVLLLAGGLEAVKQVAVIAAFPFLFVMIGLCVSLVKALRAEPMEEPLREREGAADAVGEREPEGGVGTAAALTDPQAAG